MKLLLDFDGVILRKREILRYQVHKSAQFVKHHTKLSYVQAYDINKKNYRKYGHTVLMLNDMFDTNITLQQYNEFVFNNLDFTIDDHHAEPFRQIMREFDTYIFTNSNINWVMYFAKKLNLPIQEDKVFYPKTLDQLKPFSKSYDMIDHKLNDHIIFVDDTLVNLEYPCLLENWDPVLFNNPDDLIKRLYIYRHHILSNYH